MTGVVFFNDTATTEIYTLSLHDALPISARNQLQQRLQHEREVDQRERPVGRARPLLERAVPAELEPVAIGIGQVHGLDRKSTRLNSSHANISYAVLCLQKKNTNSYR